MENKAIITTKFVLDRLENIICVIHDQDGDWQFLGDSEVSEEDARVISMNQIIDLDTTLLSIIEMPPNSIATRKTKNEKWDINDYE